MVVKNIQIYRVQVRGKWICKSKKLKVDISATTRQNSLPGPYQVLIKAETNWSFRPVKGEDYENLFENLYL